MQYITRNEEVPVSYDVDVVVVGGGPAGIGTAFTAARNGMSVVIIEQMNCLGGISTAGWHGHLCLYSSWADCKEQVVAGLGDYLCSRIAQDGYGVYNNSSCDFEVEYFKLLLEREAEKFPNLKILYYTQFSHAVVENGEIKYIIIQNKSGRQAIKARQFVDCSGDADLAARAGAPFEFGEEGTGATQPMTLMFQLGGVDKAKLSAFRKDYCESSRMTISHINIVGYLSKRRRTEICGRFRMALWAGGILRPVLTSLALTSHISLAKAALIPKI